MSLFPQWMINQIGVHKGPGIEKRPEVQRVCNAMRTLGVPINGYIEKIVEVDSLPNPDGIKFLNKDPNGMLRQVQALAMRYRSLVHDDKSTVPGAFNALVSEGESYREVGFQMRLHIEVARITDCHLDRNQIAGGVDRNGVVYYDGADGHLSIDLGPGLPFVSYLYWPLGKNTSIGPWFKVNARRPGDLRDPSGGPDEGLDFSGGISVRGTFGGRR